LYPFITHSIEFVLVRLYQAGFENPLDIITDSFGLMTKIREEWVKYGLTIYGMLRTTAIRASIDPKCLSRFPFSRQYR